MSLAKARIRKRNEHSSLATFPYNLDARDRREIVPVPDMPLLSSQPRKDAKESGAYYTPGDVAAALVRWAVREGADTLLDPSCGDGRFIARHANSVGVERDGAVRNLTNRLEWSPDSPAFDAPPFRLLDYDLRVSA